MSPDYLAAPLVAQVECLARSFQHFTGRELCAGRTGEALARDVANACCIIVSHGPQPDPILNYGNRATLKLWEMEWDEFIRTPSRLTAEAPERSERARLLAAVSECGFIDNYSGIRISKTGRRFRIIQATVWNLITESGEPYGQAAMFDRWEYLS